MRSAIYLCLWYAYLANQLAKHIAFLILNGQASHMAGYMHLVDINYKKLYNISRKMTGDSTNK